MGGCSGRDAWSPLSDAHACSMALTSLYALLYARCTAAWAVGRRQPHAQPACHSVQRRLPAAYCLLRIGLVLIRCPGCNKLHLVADHLGWFGDASWTIEKHLKATGAAGGREREGAMGWQWQWHVGWCILGHAHCMLGTAWRACAHVDGLPG